MKVISNSMRKYTMVMGILIAQALITTASAAAADSKTKRYALIVANNQSLDEGVQPLRFADDDGAKYFELFEAAAADVTLLTVLDPSAQKRYPKAAAVALPPKRKNLSQALDTLFSKMASDGQAGITTHFYFVYAGHGNIGPNQEGYLNLLDHRFRRTELYEEVVSKSPATFNHLILDACHAYFVVNKRGAKPDKQGDYRARVRNFLKRETLAAHPNTGVILAASSESETHEWHRLESGVFSHEVLSALLGAGDVDGDGAVTYAEAAACVEAANSAIDVPHARLKVHYRAPQQRNNVPLMDLNALRELPKLLLPQELAGRYYIEDGRGVRIVDLHYSSEQPITLRLTGERPFYIRTADKEAVIQEDTDATDLASLTFAPISDAHRGSVEQSFRKHLYEVPFGRGFYRGMIASKNAEQEISPPVISAMPADGPVTRKSKLKPIGLATLGCGLAVGVASGIVYGTAHAVYDDYQKADTPLDAKNYRETSDARLNASRVLLGVGAGLTALGLTLFITESIKKKRQSRTGTAAAFAPTFHVSHKGATLGIFRRF